MKQIFIGKSVDEAKQQAATEFGVDLSKIEFEIVEEPKKSFFGKLKGDAKVSAYYEPTKTDIACKYLVDVIKKIGIQDVSTSVTDTENGAVINLQGTDIDSIIGKKGQILDSLQYLTSLVSNKADKDYFRISVDCHEYRNKRKNQLETLAEKIAKGVLKNGRSSALEPMNPYERRIVHSIVAGIDGVSSHSVGDEPYRKVIITSNVKKPEKKQFNGNNNNRRRRPPQKKKSFDITTSFEKDYKKPRPEDKLGSGLYSKIEF